MIRIIPSRADSCAEKWRDTWSASTRRTVCSIRRSASAQKARANSSASPGTKRWTPSPTGCNRFRAEYGPEAILPYSYAGTMGLLNGGGMDRRFFHRLGASRLDRTICSSAGGAGLVATLGFKYGTEPEQFRHSKLIIAWGANILGTNVHLWPFIVEARRNGARFYTIDPVRNRTGKLSDKHFAIFPGSDLALALGLMHVIIGENLHDADYVANYTDGFEELKELAAKYPPERVEALTGIDRADVVALAREYATTRPAVIRLNYGIQRSERGGTAVRAIAALPALIGSWREVGGGLQLSTSQAFRLNKSGLEMPELQSRSPLGREARIVNMSELGKALTALNDPPVKAMVVYNSNPAAIAPNQNLVLKGMRRDDLVHRGAGAIPDRHRRSRRHSAAGDHVPGAHRSLPRLRPLLLCNWRGRLFRRLAKRNRTSRSSGCWPNAWASTSPVSAIPKTT